VGICCLNNSNIPMDKFPAYEWEFSDLNPPMHAWACWRVYQNEKHAHRQRRYRVSGKVSAQIADELCLVGEPGGQPGQ